MIRRPPRSTLSSSSAASDVYKRQVRYPVVLSPSEKLMGSKLVLAFGQFVCGFDVLRSHAGTFVCDVNGFSFVKKSKKYYDDTVFIWRTLLLTTLARGQIIFSRGSRMPVLQPGEEGDSEPEELTLQDTRYEPLAEDQPDKELPEGYQLRCVVSVVRHGDRTPKQKMKLALSHDDEVGATYLTLFHKFSVKPKKELKLKEASALQALLDTTEELMARLGWSDEGLSEGEEEAQGPCAADARLRQQHPKLVQMRHVLSMWAFTGINRKVQIKPSKWHNDRVTHGTLVLKWGGELTEAGISQAEALGRHARETMYRGEASGLLRLHASYRHDLKIYSSDEGRVQMTAAAFSKGFLDLEGELPPIIVGLVRKDGLNQLLDGTEPAERDLHEVKGRLYPLINANQPLTEALRAELNPHQNQQLKSFLSTVGNFKELLRDVMLQVKAMKRVIKQLKRDWEQTSLFPPLYHSETPTLFYARWKKLSDDFYDKSDDTYDISKIPDLYDNIKYDALHNVPPLDPDSVRELYLATNRLACFVVTAEYGISPEEKYSTGYKICKSLLRKILWDLQAAAGVLENEDRGETHKMLHRLEGEQVDVVRSRLYFTSESHVVALLNTLRYAEDSIISPAGEAMLQHTSELNYLSTITFRLFEDTDSELPRDNPGRFHVEMCLSPGADPTLPDFTGESQAIPLAQLPLAQLNAPDLTLHHVVSQLCSLLEAPCPAESPSPRRREDSVQACGVRRINSACSL
eukprot:TRINITY_DN6475_c0_g1_i5.p1 TRINITY_DN6475_c0_g1~~TRINITY_DN6475_c0_g1_i5.p1  ORF type:complete len:745 (+),score=240.84 TRINITY_DN6475_c0_g1_i5:115-2349(+)